MSRLGVRVSSGHTATRQHPHQHPHNDENCGGQILRLGSCDLHRVALPHRCPGYVCIE
jgi:hypothetical protein